MTSRIHKLLPPEFMKLQKMQDAATRLVTGTPRFCHVTPLLFHLHWPPISYRIKILLLKFKCLYSQAPNYLIDLTTMKKQSRCSWFGYISNPLGRVSRTSFLHLQQVYSVYSTDFLCTHLKH